MLRAVPAARAVARLTRVTGGGGGVLLRASARSVALMATEAAPACLAPRTLVSRRANHGLLPYPGSAVERAPLLAGQGFLNACVIQRASSLPGLHARAFSAAAGGSSNATDNAPPETRPGLLQRVFGRDSVFAKPDTKINRWTMVLPAFATHLCIGSPWAWSVMSGPTMHELGFVASAAADWSFNAVAMPMSIVFTLQGLAAALGGKWQMKIGTRAAIAVSGCLFGGGLLLGSLGIATHQLWLLYLGYGVMGGTGVGLAYTPPVQALMEWFPDRKGLASGLTIAGFGSGALLFAPLSSYLRDRFAVMPQYLGPLDQVETVTRDGRMYTDVAGSAQEVVLASSADIAKLGYDLAEGFYVVGSGNTGAAATLAVLGSLYFATMVSSALMIRRPPPGYLPPGYTPPSTVSSGAGDSKNSPQAAASLPGNVTMDAVLRTPQFYQLATTFFCVACGGMSLMSVAKPMMSEVFSGALPALVTAGFAGSYVMALSGGNLSGRIAWAMFSDKFGRRTTFNVFTLGSIPLYLSVPYLVDQVMTTGATWPVYAFIGTTVMAIASMGGVYAILPAYEADMFGTKYVGPIHGRFLLASSAASIVGPSILLALRGRSERSAIDSLLETVDPSRFESVFGAPIAAADQLIAAKTLTIAKLMAIVPEGTPDPSPFLYHSTMYTMAGFMTVAALSHAMLRPVAAKHFERPVIDTTGRSAS